jgi:hypothetical protein
MRAMAAREFEARLSYPSSVLESSSSSECESEHDLKRKSTISMNWLAFLEKNKQVLKYILVYAID